MFIQGFAAAFVGLVYFGFLAHAFGSEQWQLGAYALLAFVVSLSQVLGTLSLQSAAVKYIAQYQAQGEIEKAKAVATRVLQTGLLASAVIFCLLFFPADVLSNLLFTTPDLAILIRILAFNSIFTVLEINASGILQGLQRIGTVALLTLTMSVTSTFVGIGLLLYGLRLYAPVIGWLVGWSSTAVIGLFLVFKYLGFSRKLHPLRPLLSFSWPLCVSTTIALFATWADQLLLVSYMSLLYGTTEGQRILGIYYVAVRASIVPSLFANAVVIALFPSLSGLYARQGSSGLTDAFRASTRYTILIGFPLIAGLATLAYPVIILFGGWEYVGAAEPLIIISLGALITTLGLALSPILMTLERTTIASVLSLISVALSFLLSYLLVVPLNLSMVGAAWARALAGIVSLFLTLYIVTRYVKIAFDKEALWKSLAASGLLVVAIIGADLIRMLLSPSTYQFLVIRLHLVPIYVILGGVAYFVGLVLLKAIKKQDVETLKEYLPHYMRRIAIWLDRFAA